MEMRKCHVCGKEFIPAAMHAYKKIFRGHSKIFCSWKCMIAFEKEIEKRRI